MFKRISRTTVMTPSNISELFSRPVSFTLEPPQLLVVLNLVANAPDCLNHLFAICGFLDLIPQVANVDHHRLGRNHAFLLPNPLEDVIRGEDPVRVTGQEVQDPEFQGRQLNRVALARLVHLEVLAHLAHLVPLDLLYHL